MLSQMCCLQVSNVILLFVLANEILTDKNQYFKPLPPEDRLLCAIPTSTARTNSFLVFQKSFISQ